jgi:hypothetical protein
MTLILKKGYQIIQYVIKIHFIIGSNKKYNVQGCLLGYTAV